MSFSPLSLSLVSCFAPSYFSRCLGLSGGLSWCLSLPDLLQVWSRQIKEVLVASEIHLGGFGCCSNVRVVVYIIGDRVDKETTA